MASNGFSIFLTLLFVILFGICRYFLYLNLPALPGEEVDTVSVNVNETGRGSGNTSFQKTNNTVSKQFYPNMRYKNRLISYNIDSNCEQNKFDNIEEAISIIESETILNFYQSNVNAEINFLCSEIQPEAKYADHFVAGEGGPVEVINTSLYSVILAGKVSFYREDRCDRPLIAIHEILHALGFDHNNNPRSILYPTLDCEQEIDSSIISDINAIYSVEKAPDLRIIKVDVSKSGAYLNFNIEVLNQGLDDLETASLSIYADNELVKKFDLGDIDIGVKKILGVENLKVPRSSQEIGFYVDEENSIREIFEDNNAVRVILNED